MPHFQRKLKRIERKEGKVEKRYERKMDKATLLRTPEQKALADSPLDPDAGWQDPAFRANKMKVIETDRKAKVGEWKARKVGKLDKKKARIETRYQRTLTK